MGFESLIELLETEVESSEDETFSLFAQELPSHNLGFVDAKAPVLELTVAGRDLAIHQSPGVLSSNRAGGTTGAVVWKITPLFAEWISSNPSNGTGTGNKTGNGTGNFLFAHGVLSASASVLELGCGVSGVTALLLAPGVARYVLTDQAYVARFVSRNIAENSRPPAHAKPVKGEGGHRRRKVNSSNNTATGTARDSSTPAGNTNIHFSVLDWETDRVTSTLAGGDARASFDAVVACDCIYNEALIDPFVSTCADACALRQAAEAEAEAESKSGSEKGSVPGAKRPCVCIVAQQLRDPDVFEGWLARSLASFRVWRVPDELLTPGLRSNSGFVVHLAVLRDDDRRRGKTTTVVSS